MVYVWQFRTSFSKVLSTDINAVKRRDMREKMFHVDDPNPALVCGWGCVCGGGHVDDLVLAWGQSMTSVGQ